MDTSTLLSFLELLSDAPNSHIDKVFTDEVIEYLKGDDKSEPLLFLRNLLDKMVFAGGCSDFSVMAIDVVLKNFPPETTAEQLTRRANLVL